MRWTQKLPYRGAEAGGAALEYILVSTFAAVVTMAALAFVGKVVHEQLEKLAAKLGVEPPTDWVEPFGPG